MAVFRGFCGGNTVILLRPKITDFCYCVAYFTGGVLLEPTGGTTDPALLATIGWCILAFFIGSLPFGYWAGRLRGVDIREHGSGNIGATNVWRVLGWQWGAPVFALDALKGYLPVFFIQQASPPSYWIVFGGLCAILGHTYSPFIGFKGGKGVATSLGVVIGFSWQVAAIAFAVFVMTLLATWWVSLGSILGAITAAIAFFLLPPHLLHGDPLPYRIFAVLTMALIIYRHRSNIQRMRDGTEPRFGKKQTPPTE